MPLATYPCMICNGTGVLRISCEVTHKDTGKEKPCDCCGGKGYFRIWVDPNNRNTERDKRWGLSV